MWLRIFCCCYYGRRGKPGFILQPREVLAQAGHHNDGIIAQRVSLGSENEAINDDKRSK